MDETIDFFPLGLASEGAFCNRVSERARLQRNFQGSRPCLLVSPRRYGKTSLAIQAIEDSKLDYVVMDFFIATDLTMITQAILNGVAELTTRIMKTPERALRAVQEIFKHLRLSLDLGRLKVILQPDSKQPENQVILILETLKQLEKWLSEQKKQAILFFDEFQVLGQFKESSALEGALRHMAQQSRAIGFLFSGSQRHLLSIMFDDRNRPLYLLCDRIQIDRIASKHYEDYFEHAAKQNSKWDPKIKLSPKLSQTILDLTESHPYYVNVLCSRLWAQTNIPTVEETQKRWHGYALEEKSRVAYDLNQLSVNQRKLMIALAKEEEVLITSQHFLQGAELSSASSLQAANVLLERDYLYLNANNKYCILDPLMRYVIKLFY
jgi:hypothetical protein